MEKADLVRLLATRIPSELARDLVEDFLKIRQDVLTGTLERAAPGKFVETLVQILQHLDRGSYEDKPKVDAYLRTLDSTQSNLPDGLRLCAARIGRAMYTLRNKRNILHKGSVDPNQYDLRFLHAASQWIMAELIRTVAGSSMEEAGKLCAQVQAPVGGLVEDFGDRRLVLGDLKGRDEMLVLLHSRYPEPLSVMQLEKSMDRRSPGYVRRLVRELWAEKLVEGDGSHGYALTRRGLRAATEVLALHTA